jgi:hypothetical protein
MANPIIKIVRVPNKGRQKGGFDLIDVIILSAFVK